jgi:hypothetical protein
MAKKDPEQFSLEFSFSEKPEELDIGIRKAMLT